MGHLLYFFIGMLIGGILGILLMCLIIVGAGTEDPRKDLPRRKR